MIIVLGIDIKKFEMQNYIKINCGDFIFTDILINLNIIGSIIGNNV